jgi:hypothetical protein
MMGHGLGGWWVELNITVLKTLKTLTASAEIWTILVTRLHEMENMYF